MSYTFLKFAHYQVPQVLAIVSHATPLYVSIGHLEEAKTAHQLTKMMHKIQSSLWKLTQNERLLASQRVTTVLSKHVLNASDASLRLDAAGWLRLLVQTGAIAQPERAFVTMVTAAIHASRAGTQERSHELRTYLKLIFESFWPFRSPYATYPGELFPSNAVFYPLAPLLSQADSGMHESLLIIFAELPTLDDAEIEEHLLPTALTESSHADPEHRRSVAPILARMSHPLAQEALVRLQLDQHPLVSESAKKAGLRLPLDRDEKG
jgi:hypothetical protein